MATLSPQEKEAMVKAVTKALGYQENGGKPNLQNLSAGKSGELKSIFQFTPDTWKSEAKKYLGNQDEPLTPDAETTVVQKQVADWVDQGKTVRQMASMWNAGHGEPDAYTGKFSNGKPSTGINNHGVKFNVPAYANKVNDYAKQFYMEYNKPQTASVNLGVNTQPIQPSGLLPTLAAQNKGG